MTNRISVIGANSTLSPVLFGILLLHQNEAVVKINLALSWAFVSKILQSLRITSCGCWHQWSYLTPLFKKGWCAVRTLQACAPCAHFGGGVRCSPYKNWRHGVGVWYGTVLLEFGYKIDACGGMRYHYERLRLITSCTSSITAPNTPSIGASVEWQSSLKPTLKGEIKCILRKNWHIPRLAEYLW